MRIKNKYGTCKTGNMLTADETPRNEICKPELALLDMYSGCGGMSTGLCLGAKVCGVDIVTVIYQEINFKFHKFYLFRN